MTVDLPPWRKSLAWRGRFSKVRSQSASEYSIINQQPTHFVDWGSQRQAYSDNSIRHVLGRRLDFSHFQILLRWQTSWGIVERFNNAFTPGLPGWPMDWILISPKLKQHCRDLPSPVWAARMIWFAVLVLEFSPIR
jgi:hypothetical protein